MPAGSHVRATSASAELLGEGRLGDVTFESSNGAVKHYETGSARLALLAGDITVGRLGGPGEITTEKGDIHITEAVQGVVTLRTVSGDVTVGVLEGVVDPAQRGACVEAGGDSVGGADGAPALTIHATTTQGDIFARSL